MLVYVALQELATRIAHRNTGQLLDDRAGYDVMMRVAADENLHHLFYRDLASAAIELDPSTMVQRDRAPGRRRSRCPAPASPTSPRTPQRSPRPAIYDFAIHHDQILVPVVLRQWGLESITGLDDAAEASRDRLLARLATSERVARRIAARRGEAALTSVS